LWYSGDDDTSNPNWDGLYNALAEGQGILSQVYVPFLPAPDGNPLHLHAAISSVTFNMISRQPNNNPPADYAGMTYEFRSKQVVSGNGGTLGKHGSCYSSTVVYTGTDVYGFNHYGFTCYFKVPIKVAVGTVGWVNLTPTFTGASYTYLIGATDVPASNQTGWGNVFYQSFTNSSSFGSNWQPTTAVANGLEEFSIAMAGTYTN
jgi:hypothetical protein